MTDQYASTVAKWDEIGRSDPTERRREIADVADYEFSGYEHAQQVMAVIPPGRGKTLLDYGCGDGRIARHLAGRYQQVHGFDTSEAMCRAFDENVVHGMAVHYNPKVLLSASERFTGVYSMNVFIHHTHEDCVRMMKELPPADLYALQMPVYETAHSATGYCDICTWTPKLLAEAAREAGLIVEAIFTNPGTFTMQNIGPNHRAFQLFRRP